MADLGNEIWMAKSLERIADGVEKIVEHMDASVRNAEAMANRDYKAEMDAAMKHMFESNPVFKAAFEATERMLGGGEMKEKIGASTSR